MSPAHAADIAVARSFAEKRRHSLYNLPDEDWRPVQTVNRSRYSYGTCERCAGRIEPGERVHRRYWRHGPAEAEQHIHCPTLKPCYEHRIVGCACTGPIAAND